MDDNIKNEKMEYNPSLDGSTYGYERLDVKKKLKKAFVKIKLIDDFYDESKKFI